MIEAAGGAVWRSNSRGQHLVLLVHRPAYDDWSLPKGKLMMGEAALDAAQREVLEETGLSCDVGPELPSVRYTDRKGRPKRVRYWAMQRKGGRFVPNREVDRIEWLRLEDAGERLTYAHDVAVIEALADLLPVAMRRQ